jgi:hypothetical protein
MEASLKQLVENFDANPMEAARARREIHEMLKQDSARFSRALIQLLQSVSDTAGYRYLFRLLLDQGLLYELLCDPSNFSLEQAVTIARSLQKLDPQADTTLARLLLKPSAGRGSAARTEAQGVGGGFGEERILEIAASVSSGARLLPILVQLLKSSNQKVRSKATLLVGRMAADARAVEAMLADPDPRTRANAVESLWAVKSREAETIFRNAILATDGRTSANGLVGLYRSGRLESIALILERANHPDPQLRAHAAWVMGNTGDPRFLPELKRLLQDGDSKVRRHVLTALGGIKRQTERLRAAAPLQIFLTRIPGEPASTRLRAAVTSAIGSPVANLAPTNFIVWRAASSVSGFSVLERPAPERIVVGIASAIFSLPAHPLNLACRKALAASAKLARDSDRWFLTEAKALPRHPDALLQAFEASKLPFTPCEDLWEATGRALADVPAGSGSRHVLVIGAAPEPPGEAAATELREVAIRNRAAVNVLTIGPSAELAALSAETGGIYMTAGSKDELPALAAGIYRSLLHNYEIVFPAAAGDGNDIRIQIVSEEGLGEAVPGPAMEAAREPSAAA